MVMKRVWTLVIGLAIVLAGCGGESQNASQQGKEGADHKESNAIVVADVTGVELEFEKEITRIACLTEICVDSLAELGLEPIAATVGGIASLPEFFGEDATSFQTIGGSFLEPNLEDIAAAQPELVIGLQGTHEGLREGLKDIAPLFITQPKTYVESVEFLEMMGELTGRKAEAEAAGKKLLDKLEAYKDLSPKDKSALIMYGSDVNFGIDTAGSLVGSMLAEVTEYPWPAPAADGGHQAGGMAYSLEKVLETDPDWIFVETFSFGDDAPSLSEQFKANPLWAKLQAVQQEQIVEVRTAIWASGRGTRSLGIVLDEAMQILYPDVVKEVGVQ